MPLHTTRHSPLAAIRSQLGCWFHERWRTELVIGFPRLARLAGMDWKDLCNRREVLTTDETTGGRICQWQDSSPLTVARLYPRVGARLLQHCLKQFPVNFQRVSTPHVADPEVTFVIGVRGTGRLPQFQATVASLLGQQDCPIEVIVVEQSWEQQFQNIVPSGVRYIYTRPDSPDMPFNRSWALNVGARNAKGRVVVLHDGDYVVPAVFAREIALRLQNGIESLRLPRLIFYLDQQSSASIQTNLNFRDVQEVNRVVQNNPTPMALTKEAYMRIGGHDESFYGWGGEDNEFLDRARTLRHCEGAFLPIIHLWHAEAPNRSGDRNSQYLSSILEKPVQERIGELSQREFGRDIPSRPWRVSQ